MFVHTLTDPYSRCGQCSGCAQTVPESEGRTSLVSSKVVRVENRLLMNLMMSQPQKPNRESEIWGNDVTTATDF
jgi:hypothetical protein